MAVGNFKRKMRTVKTREIVRRREVDGYERIRVEMERRAGCGDSECDSKISVDGDVLWVVNERFGEALEMLERDEV